MYIQENSRIQDGLFLEWFFIQLVPLFENLSYIWSWILILYYQRRIEKRLSCIYGKKGPTDRILVSSQLLFGTPIFVPRMNTLKYNKKEILNINFLVCSSVLLPALLHLVLGYLINYSSNSLCSNLYHELSFSSLRASTVSLVRVNQFDYSKSYNIYVQLRSVSCNTYIVYIPDLHRSFYSRIIVIWSNLQNHVEVEGRLNEHLNHRRILMTYYHWMQQQ